MFLFSIIHGKISRLVPSIKYFSFSISYIEKYFVPSFIFFLGKANTSSKDVLPEPFSPTTIFIFSTLQPKILFTMFLLEFWISIFFSFFK